MEKKYLTNPHTLLDLGFTDISEQSTDLVRTLLFERELKRSSIRFRARFTQYISDAPQVSFRENNQYDFEEFTISTVEGDEGFSCIQINTMREFNRLLVLIS